MQLVPRLIEQLFEADIFIEIGQRDFQIPRSLFNSRGDTSSFFSLGFAEAFKSKDQVFPGLDREALFRPPAIEAPRILDRSASTFEDILQLLKGYPLEIKSTEHRAALLRDCRYYVLKGLEQKLIYHHISFNADRQREEIVMRLEDLTKSGISFVSDVTPSDRSPLGGWVNYARPSVDDKCYELIVEIGGESTKIDFRSMRAEFYGDVKARITSLFQVVADKMNLPTNIPLGLMMTTGGAAAQPVSPGNTPLSEDRVKVRIERDAHIVLDGEEFLKESLDEFRAEVEDATEFINADGVGFSSTQSVHSNNNNSNNNWRSPEQMGAPSRSPSVKPPPRKRKRRGSLDDFGEWIVRRGQWRLRVQPRVEQSTSITSGPRMEIVLQAIKLDAFSGQRGRNASRGFLVS
jgi:hypothetical protein